MELLILWIGSIIVSFSMEIINELKIFKDVADQGYKIDISRINELTKASNKENAKNTLMTLLIPGVNIASVLQRTMQYNSTRWMLIDQLKVMDFVTPFTKEEQQKYNQKPTVMNAISLNVLTSTEKRTSNASISYLEGKKKNTIYFKYENKKLIIVSAKGPVSKLSKEYQKKKVEEQLAEYGEFFDIHSVFEMTDDHKIDNILNLLDYMKEEKKIDEENNKENMSVNDQKIKLEEFRKTLISESEKEEPKIKKLK